VPDTEDLLTSIEVARRLAVAPRAVRMWAQRGWLSPALITPGGHFRFRWSEVEAQLLAARRRADR
jgi:DNA-binding transcriptional MerR regulator